MRFQAHRGVSSECPENTMPAFRAAWEQGYHVLEVDPRFTSDGRCVAFHDNTINRTCRTSDGAVIEEQTVIETVSYDDLICLDAGLYKGEQFRGTRVPLMEEVFAFAAEKGLDCKIDNKFSSFPIWQQEVLFDIAERSGARVGFTCKNLEVVKQVVDRFPNVEIHYDGLVTEEILQAIEVALKNNRLTVWLAQDTPLTWWVKIPKATPELCAMVKRYGKLGLWLLNTHEELEEAKALGADIIETNGVIKPE